MTDESTIDEQLDYLAAQPRLKGRLTLLSVYCSDCSTRVFEIVATHPWPTLLTAGPQGEDAHSPKPPAELEGIERGRWLYQNTRHNPTRTRERVSALTFDPTSIERDLYVRSACRGHTHEATFGWLLDKLAEADADRPRKGVTLPPTHRGAMP